MSTLADVYVDIDNVLGEDDICHMTDDDVTACCGAPLRDSGTHFDNYTMGQFCSVCKRLKCPDCEYTVNREYCE